MSSNSSGSPKPSGGIRRAQKAATRAALKKTARDCFVKSGFAGTAIADIAKAAGVAHGTFYVHFDSKEAMLDELLDDFNAELARRLQPVVAVAAGRPVEDTVRATAEVFVDHWQSERGFVECYAQRSAVGLALTSMRDGINPPVAGLLKGALLAAAASRGVALPNVDLVMHGLLALWLRIGLQYLFNEDVERDDAVTALVEMSTGAVAAVLVASDPESKPTKKVTPSRRRKKK